MRDLSPESSLTRARGKGQWNRVIPSPVTHRRLAKRASNAWSLQMHDSASQESVLENGLSSFIMGEFAFDHMPRVQCRGEVRPVFEVDGHFRAILTVLIQSERTTRAATSLHLTMVTRHRPQRGKVQEGGTSVLRNSKTNSYSWFCTQTVACNGSDDDQQHKRRQ
jgi:hypothetical protein